MVPNVLFFFHFLSHGASVRAWTQTLNLGSEEVNVLSLCYHRWEEKEQVSIGKLVDE